jgi:DNA-binding response OmpR family regulator
VSSTGPQSSSSIRVLVVEDEKKIAALLEEALRGAGFVTEVVHDGEAALEKMGTQNFDVVVLDIMLPRRDGLSILKEARSKGIKTPVLALSARGEVGERVEGLESGADDYLAKPFVLAEVLARIRALSRRTQDQKTGTLQVSDLILDPLKRIAKRGNRTIELAAREFMLLEFLMRSKGQICGRAVIIKHVWGYKFDPGTNLVDVYIMRVREKIDGGFDRKLLHTIRGIGYVLREET